MHTAGHTKYGDKYAQHCHKILSALKMYSKGAFKLIIYKNLVNNNGPNYNKSELLARVIRMWHYPNFVYFTNE